jgi:hypothetical protein
MRRINEVLFRGVAAVLVIHFAAACSIEPEVPSQPIAVDALVARSQQVTVTTCPVKLDARQRAAAGCAEVMPPGLPSIDVTAPPPGYAPAGRAFGNGSSDDRLAVQAMIQRLKDLGTGGTLTFPGHPDGQPRTYVFSTDVSKCLNLLIRRNAGPLQIKLGANVTLLMKMASANCAWVGFSLDGAQHVSFIGTRATDGSLLSEIRGERDVFDYQRHLITQPPANSNRTYPVSTGIGIKPHDDGTPSHHIQLDGIRVTQFTGEALSLRQTTNSNADVTACRSELVLNGRTAVAIHPGKWVTVRDSVLACTRVAPWFGQVDNWRYSTEFQAAIDLETYIPGAGSSVRKIDIAGNTIAHNPGRGIELFSTEGEPYNDITIRANLFVNNGGGISFSRCLSDACGPGEREAVTTKGSHIEASFDHNVPGNFYKSLSITGYDAQYAAYNRFYRCGSVRPAIHLGGTRYTPVPGVNQAEFSIGNILLYGYTQTIKYTHDCPDQNGNTPWLCRGNNTDATISGVNWVDLGGDSCFVP